MFKEARPLTIIVDTPLHAGSGSELGVVDLPIQRERHTNDPKIEASSLKGCLREAFEAHHTLIPAFKDLEKEYIQKCVNPVFGADPDKNKQLEIETSEEYASALGVTDARLLLFPVKSIRGVFAWITCPGILNRLLKDLTLAQTMGCDIPVPNIGANVVTLENSVATGTNLFVKENQIILEEYAFSLTISGQCKALAKWIAKHALPQDDSFAYWRTKIQQDLVVLSDDDFCDFVTMSTEVITRTKISDDTGTVQRGMLWDEEYLPADSILYTLVLASDPLLPEKHPIGFDRSANAVMKFFIEGLARAQHIFQLGGNATIGKGLVRVAMMG